MYRGADALAESGAERATRQTNADKIGDKAQRIRRAADTARKAKDRADAHENELSSGVLRALDIGEMALLNRLNGELPNRNLATLQDATKIGDGVVAARTLISQDAASFNLWAQNAMIRSAKIETLAVDKLAAGTFTAGQIILAGVGALKAGQIMLDAGGVTMPALSNWTVASASRDYKITSTNELAAIGFFNDSNATAQGAGIRADGNGPTRTGVILLNATQDQTRDVYDASSAWVHVNAQRGVSSRSHVYMGQDLVVERDVNIKGFAMIDGRVDINGVLNPNAGIDPTRYCRAETVPANGGWYQWEHGHPSSAVWPHFQVAVGSDWQPIEYVPNLYVAFVGPNNVRVQNDRQTSELVRGFILGMVDV